MSYIGAIVNILEIPQQRIVKDDICVTEFRAQLAQYRKTQIVNVVIWGKLTDDQTNYSNLTGSILVEGHVSISFLPSSKYSEEFLKKTQITVLKMYPLPLNSN